MFKIHNKSLIAHAFLTI